MTDRRAPEARSGLTTRHLLSMIGAEARAIYGRGSARLAMVVAVLCGVVVALAMQWLFTRAGMGAVDAQINGNPISQMVEFSAGAVGGWALRLRNLFVLPLVLLLATAASLAGELGDHTLREVLVRPVPRWSVLAAKFVVLAVLALVTQALTAAPALGAGMVFFGTDGPTSVQGVLLGYAASWLSDLGLIAIGMLVSTFARSVGAVVVGTMLLLMADLGIRAVLQGMIWLGVSGAEAVQRAMPGNALACWEGFTGDWDPAAFVGLAVIFGVCMALTGWRFQRLDVP
ncbi:MAG: ABC transporter permease [Deltaproteobacteria bacterium]|nr:MAG: ABC transporter permease [Deltaproteobacteria bacterium]